MRQGMTPEEARRQAHVALGLTNPARNIQQTGLTAE